ncbi:MAG: flagellar biosynthesis/type III secretory pathway M-ring protein FliF/YscJ [Chlamydiales bacterium]|jgi:flagellar biosynthesis/type III secretory pathway M-ring protein FliF/YscJ
MKDLLSKLFLQLKDTNGPTRIVVAAAMFLVVAMVGISTYRAANPAFTLLRSNLDESQLGSASGAIANAGIRFKTSNGPGPYTIWAEDGRYHEALNAIYLEGALSASPRGIESGPSGAASAFLGSGERRQLLQKRKWQEVEKMLEVYNWIARATINSSSPPHTAFARPQSETISVVLQLRGILDPDREQSETVATIVSSAFGVKREQVVISDQYGRSVFNGARDKGFDEVLEFQRSHDRDLQRDVQAVLDETYGVGLAVATVHSRWTHDLIESVNEGVDPGSKTPLSKRTFESETPTPSNAAGGLVGADANSAAGAAGPAPVTLAPATTSESTEDYLVGRTTVHKVQSAPQLDRLAVTLLLDDSLVDQLPKASEWVKGIVGFDDTRGDTFTSNTARFSGLERDESGAIVPPLEEPAPEPANETVELLIERGVEIVAALGFLFILMKSLKKSDKAAAQRVAVSGSGPEAVRARMASEFADEDVDVGMLAKQQISDLLANDPDRVSAILSRWALDDTFVGSK